MGWLVGLIKLAELIDGRGGGWDNVLLNFSKKLNACSYHSPLRRPPFALYFGASRQLVLSRPHLVVHFDLHLRQLERTSSVVHIVSPNELSLR